MGTTAQNHRKFQMISLKIAKHYQILISYLLTYLNKELKLF